MTGRQSVDVDAHFAAMIGMASPNEPSGTATVKPYRAALRILRYMLDVQ